MTNRERRYLAQLCRDGYSFQQIRPLVDCCDATIRRYLKWERARVAEREKKKEEK